MTGPDLPDDRKVEQSQERSFFSRPPRPPEPHEPLELPDDVFEEEEESRSIFSATWFRVVVVVVVLGVAAALAGPYVLDTVNPPPIGARATIESTGTTESTAETTATPAPGTVTPAATQTTDQPAIAPTAPSAAQTSTESTPGVAAPATPTATPATLITPAKATPVKDEGVTAATTAKKDESGTKAAGDTPTPRLAQPAPAPIKNASTPKIVARATEPARAAASQPAVDPAAAVAATKGGDFWVQVGAFKSPDMARRVAARLRQQRYPVQESVKGAAAAAATPEAGDRYLVVVDGATPAQVAPKLSTPGLTAEANGTGVIVRPSLALREAVELSRALEANGLRVQVRRTTRDAGSVASNDVLHRVRVGGFRDRAAAVAASRQLTQKGYQTYVARGNE